MTRGTNIAGRFSMLAALASVAACTGSSGGGSGPTTIATPAPRAAATTTADSTSTTSTTITPAGGGTATISSTVPGGGGWVMTFEADYAVEDYRICSESIGPDCPVTANVVGELTFGNPMGADELYVTDAGSAEQTQTSTYNDDRYKCGTRTGAATLAVDVAVTQQGGDFLMWFGGGGFTAGPFIDTVFLGAACETGPQPATFWFSNLLVPAQPGTYQFAVADFGFGDGEPVGMVTTTDFSPADREPRIQLTVTLALA